MFDETITDALIKNVKIFSEGNNNVFRVLPFFGSEYVIKRDSENSVIVYEVSVDSNNLRFVSNIKRGDSMFDYLENERTALSLNLSIDKIIKEAPYLKSC